MLKARFDGFMVVTWTVSILENDGVWVLAVMKRKPKTIDRLKLPGIPEFYIIFPPTQPLDSKRVSHIMCIIWSRTMQQSTLIHKNMTALYAPRCVDQHSCGGQKATVKSWKSYKKTSDSSSRSHHPAICMQNPCHDECIVYFV